jgi:gluconolactonase
MTLSAEAAPKPPVTLARGLKFPEGPVLSADGKTLYAVNVQSSAISRLDLKTKALAYTWVTLPDGGRGNGMTLGPDGALYVADVGRKLIARIALPDGRITTVVDRAPGGGLFRGPNDLIFDKMGGIYFTDPDGSWDKPVASVYHVAPKTHAVSLVADGLQFPNGLVLAADEKTLYVAESPLHRITAIDVTPNGIVPPGRKHVFCVTGTVGGGDGMRLGRDGFLYAAIYGEGVIAKISPQGEVVYRYDVGGGKHPTNLCFAHDERSLYVTETDTNTIIQLRL